MVPIAAVIHAAIVQARHLLQMHHFLMISAVVVHDHQQRNFVVRRGPKRARRVHQIAVALDGDGDDALVAIGECRADGSRRAVALTRRRRNRR